MQKEILESLKDLAQEQLKLASGNEVVIWAIFICQLFQVLLLFVLSLHFYFGK